MEYCVRLVYEDFFNICTCSVGIVNSFLVMFRQTEGAVSQKNFSLGLCVINASMHLCLLKNLIIIGAYISGNPSRNGAVAG